MKIVYPEHTILTQISEGGLEELKMIERVGRVCYKSEERISPDGESAKKFVKMIIDKGHEAVLEHSSLSVLFVTDRAVSHELVRHRMASFAQESQRYCNYEKDKFGREVSFVTPWWIVDIAMRANKCQDIIFTPLEATIKGQWIESCKEAEKHYFKLLDTGMSPQDARATLPNSTKTEIVVTANYREWRHILKLRTSDAAHPDMRRLMNGLLIDLKARIPIVFDDI